MSILKIARMGHPVLKRPAEPVVDPRSPAIRQLVVDMIETMGDAAGVGLAAPQVHVPLRVVVFRPPADPARDEGDDDEDADNAVEAAARRAARITILINPEIEPLGDEQVSGLEACLSVPGLAGVVPRYRRVRYRWTDLEGARHEREAEEFHARVVQHECDHLDGVLYPMRMTDLSSLSFTTELDRGRTEEV